MGWLLESIYSHNDPLKIPPLTTAIYSFDSIRQAKVSKTILGGLALLLPGPLGRNTGLEESPG